MKWKEIWISREKTHHIINNEPLYRYKFQQVLKFHDPGYAPAKKEDLWFHIDLGGRPAYSQRFTRTFGYYFHKAAVNDKGNWYGWEISRESQLEDANLYSIAKAFAESVNKGEVKVKYEEESSTDEQKVPF